jgi:hypothetical protein
MAITDNLVAYWSMDESSGVRYDRAGSHNLTDNNTVLSEVGKVGASAVFVANQAEYLSVADHSDFDLAETDYTIVLWIRPNRRVSTPVISKRSVSALGYRNAPGNEWTITYYSAMGTTEGGGYDIQAVWLAPSNSAAYGGFAAYLRKDVGIQIDGSPGEYGFVCFTLTRIDTNGVALVNKYSEQDWQGGVRLHHSTSDNFGTQRSDNSTNPVRVGSNASGEYFDGGIDEVGIWRRALSNNEVFQLWHGGEGLAYPFPETAGSDLDWNSTGSLETLHRRHHTPDRTNPVVVKYDYSWSEFLNQPAAEVPDVCEWGSPPEVPVLPREHRLTPYRPFVNLSEGFVDTTLAWWLQASEPVMSRQGLGERAYWQAGQHRESPVGDPTVPTTNPAVPSPSVVTGGGDTDIIPPTAEPSIDGKTGLYIPERPDLEDNLRPRVDEPE